MTGQTRRLREECAALGEAARKAGGQGLVPYYLLVGADAAYRDGDWPAAERDIDEAVAIADHSAQRGPLSIALVVRARIHAARGRAEAAREDAEAGVTAAEPPGYGSTLLWAQRGAWLPRARRGPAPTAAIGELEGLRADGPVRRPRGPARSCRGRPISSRRTSGRAATRTPGASRSGSTSQAERSGVPLALRAGGALRGARRSR